MKKPGPFNQFKYLSKRFFINIPTYQQSVWSHVTYVPNDLWDHARRKESASVCTCFSGPFPNSFFCN